MSDGHPDWNINLQSGEASVENPAGPATASPQPTPEPASAPGDVTPPPTPEPPAPAAPQGENFIPKYRFDAVNDRAATVARENQELKELLRTALASRQPSAAPAPPPSPEDVAYTEQTEAIRQEFFKRFPEFAKMAESWDTIQSKLDAIAPVAELVPQMTERENRYWGNVAQTSLGAVQEAVSTTHLNGAKIDPASPQGQHIARTFFEWTSGDPVRVDRYERNDPSLVKEFAAFFGNTFIAPWRPAAGPPAVPAGQAAAARVARLPVAGPSGIPSPARPTPRDPTNEDAVHADGWAFVKNQQQASGA